VGALATAGAEPASPWSPGRGPSGFRLNDEPRRLAHVRLEDLPVELAYAFGPSDDLLRLSENELVAFHEGAALRLSLEEIHSRGGGAGGFDGSIRTPMPGRIVRVAVVPGELIAAGQTLVVLEAMKMEHALTAPVDGEVAEVGVAEGDQVIEGLIAVRLAKAPAAG
jgi:acetyl/propionyl-CoA carboxylase alpha subunit